MLRQQRNANAAVRGYFQFTDSKSRFQSLLQTLGKAHGLRGVGQCRQQHTELLTVQAREVIVTAQGLAQASGDLRDQFIIRTRKESRSKSTAHSCSFVRQ